MNAEQPGNNATGLWTIADYQTHGSFDDNTLYNSRVYNLWSGDNYFKWEITRNGCRSADTVIISWVYSVDNVVNADSELILIYPNPASTYLNIEFPDISNYTVCLYDLTGRKLISEKIKQQNFKKLNVNMISDGVYKIEIKNKNLRFIKTIVIAE